MIDTDDYKFSFSGVKTSVLYFLRDNKIIPPIEENLLKDICASFQKSIVDVLIAKTFKAAEKYQIKNIAIAGGVSANSRIRNQFKIECEKRNYKLFIPQISYCTDNAAMISVVGYRKYLSGFTSALTSTAHPYLELSNL